jgi:PAS domain S-box-containing protein
LPVSDENLELILKSLPIAMAVVDQRGRIRLTNTRLDEMFGYDQAELSGQTVELLLPARWRESHTKHRVAYMRQPQVRLMGSGLELVGLRKDGREFPIEVGLSVVERQGEMQVITSISDITIRKQAKEILEQQVKERTRELSLLLTMQNAITSRLDSDAVLQLIADKARQLTGACLSLVCVLEGEDLRVAALSGQAPRELMVGYRIPVAQSIAGSTIQSGQPLLIADTRLDPRTANGSALWPEISCCLSVPLLAESQPIGVIIVTGNQPASLQAEDERILTMLAPGAVVALENARLYHLEQERRRVAEGLRDILAILNSDRPVDESLDYIISQACRLLQAQASTVFRRQDDLTFVAQTSRGLSERVVAGQGNHAFNIATLHSQDLLNRQPTILPDLQALVETGDHPAAARSQTLLAEGFRAVLALPLVVRDEIYGALVLYFAEPREFSADDIDLATSLCDHAALAIENARLKSQAEAAAVVAERHRLAHDLHDAVSQTLFSASLIAEMIPRVGERYPEEANRKLKELCQLTRGALAEMRILLVELRPAALTTTKLGSLIRQLSEAITGRTHLPISLLIRGDRSLPPEVQIAFYRIAQEALNNIVKHAQASQVDINLWFWPAGVKLGIKDNGVGFDPKAISADHLGVSIMHERAKAVGARLKLASRSGQGTRVAVMWRDNQEGGTR